MELARRLTERLGVGLDIELGDPDASGTQVRLFLSFPSLHFFPFVSFLRVLQQGAVQQVLRTAAEAGFDLMLGSWVHNEERAAVVDFLPCSAYTKAPAKGQDRTTPEAGDGRDQTRRGF